MAKKPVTINGRHFGSRGEANEFFKHLRTQMHADETRAYSGPIFETLDWLYREYCRVTAYPMPGEPVGYRVKYIAGTGDGITYGSTLAFHVEFTDGRLEDFSAIKAVRFIADHQRTGTLFPGLRAAAPAAKPDDLSV